jgi:hypothetical protein
LLGIKVIKLNKIKGTPTVGAQIARRSKSGASHLFKARNFRLPTQTKISPQIHRQKIGGCLMPNEKS